MGGSRGPRKMKRISYLYTKIIKAWSSGTLREKAIRFLVTSVRRPLEVLIGYIRLSKTDRNLNVKDGFADHRQEKDHHRSNLDHIRRIIAAYKESKQLQCQAASPFEIRGLWDEWTSVNFRKLVTALEVEDFSELSRLLENLFREQCTIGMGGYDNYVRYHSAIGSLYVKYVWSSYRDKLLTLDFDPHKICFPHVGNQTGVVLNGKVISIETLRHAYHAVEMCELLRDVPKAICVEIGAGLGGQAYQTVQMGSERISKYVLFDIPEVAALSSYFLLSAFPNKRVRLFGEGPVSVSSSQEYDIAVFPHYSIIQLSNSSVDLFYNSCSFSEMDGATSREYLSIIEGSCRKYFLHDNHDASLKFKCPDGSTSTNVIGSKLVPNPALFKRIFKKPRVHGLLEDRSFVHFEYLYEKIL
jgi:putative sugar O-methyltransferase